MYQVGICSGDKEMSARVERFILAGHRIKVYKYISESAFIIDDILFRVYVKGLIEKYIRRTKSCIKERK